MQLLPEWSSINKVVIGMLHLRPLPGSPRFDGNLAGVRESLLRDAEALVQGGVHGMMMENFGDVPFFAGRVPAHVVAHMTALACEVKRQFDLPLGINVLRNDGRSALAVAQAAGASFIRVNVLVGARVTDQGIIEGIAHELLRDRAILGAGHIRILADIDVKHSAPLAARDLRDELNDTIHRGLADAVVASGAGTGKPTDPRHLAQIRSSAGQTPVFVGSGVSVHTLSDLLPHADGFIIGTSLKKEAQPQNPVDVNLVRELMRVINGRDVKT
jgi:hypothetical protein